MDTINTQQGIPLSNQAQSNMKSENRILQWFKNNWFLWVFLIVAYVSIRLAGYDVTIRPTKQSYNPKEPAGLFEGKGKYD